MPWPLSWPTHLEKHLVGLDGDPSNHANVPTGATQGFTKAGSRDWSHGARTGRGVGEQELCRRPRRGRCPPPAASGAVKGPWRHLERARRKHTPSRLQAPTTTFSKRGWTETGTEVERLGVLVLRRRRWAASATHRPGAPAPGAEVPTPAISSGT